MEWKIDQGESGVIGQGEAQGRLHGGRQNFNLDFGLARNGHRRAQKSKNPGLDLPDVMEDDGRGVLEGLAS